MMRFSRKKTLIAGALLIALFAIGCWLYGFYAELQKTLGEARGRSSLTDRVGFEKIRLAPRRSPHLRIEQKTTETRAVAPFLDSLFAATSGGLVQYASAGDILRHYTVLDGLPESDLTALAVYEGSLYIGTRASGLVVFDGETFFRYAWTDRQAQSIEALAAIDGRLLIGTRTGGLIEFDGAAFAEIKADGKRIEAVSLLRKIGAELFVGTFDQGLLINRAGVWTRYTTADGLASNRIVGVDRRDGATLVAADFGLAVLEGNIFRTVAVVPALSSLAVFERRLYLSEDDGTLYMFDRALARFETASNGRLGARLVVNGDVLLLLSDQGIARVAGDRIRSLSGEKNDSLTDNFVSALAFDERKNLWAGTFRRGLDVFSAAGKKIAHVETEIVREINFLAPTGGAMTAATSNGMVRFGRDFSPAAATTRRNGLPADAVTHFSGERLATANGLAEKSANRFRLLSTVQGLPSNSLYATLDDGAKFYAGTLGGLAEIENGRVVRVYKDSNSRLATNWVTALCKTRERIFIGTYGGGLFELTAAGEIRSFEAETGRFAVNPNALYSDGARLYAGTLAGVVVLDLDSLEWSTLTHELPAAVVMSINGDDRHVYFGTTGGIARIARAYFEEKKEK